MTIGYKNIKGGYILNNVIKQIIIDLYSSVSYEVIQAQQNDNNSRIIEFILYNQGTPYVIPSNISIKMEGHRGDNSSFIKDCTTSNNVITATLDSDILYYSGTVVAKIVMYDLTNDSILSTIPFRIHVEKNPCDKNKIEKGNTSLIDWIVLSYEKLKQSFEVHKADTIAHLSTEEHKRLDTLTNEVVIGIGEEVPNYLQNGDSYLQEYN